MKEPKKIKEFLALPRLINSERHFPLWPSLVFCLGSFSQVFTQKLHGVLTGCLDLEFGQNKGTLSFFTIEETWCSTTNFWIISYCKFSKWRFSLISYGWGWKQGRIVRNSDPIAIIDMLSIGGLIFPFLQRQGRITSTSIYFSRREKKNLFMKEKKTATGLKCLLLSQRSCRLRHRHPQRRGNCLSMSAIGLRRKRSPTTQKLQCLRAPCTPNSCAQSVWICWKTPWQPKSACTGIVVSIC